MAEDKSLSPERARPVRPWPVSSLMSAVIRRASKRAHGSASKRAHGPLSVSSAEDWSSASTERRRGTETPLRLAVAAALRRLFRKARWALSSGLHAGELVLYPEASSPGSWSCAAPGAAGTGGKRSSGRLSPSSACAPSCAWPWGCAALPPRHQCRGSRCNPLTSWVLFLSRPPAVD